jgi:hypothetical protein
VSFLKFYVKDEDFSDQTKGEWAGRNINTTDDLLPHKRIYYPPNPIPSHYNGQHHGTDPQKLLAVGKRLSRESVKNLSVGLWALLA